MRAAGCALVLASVSLVTHDAAAQGFRIRVDMRGQSAAFRGVTLDSIPVADTVMAPGSGPTSPDGFAVQCQPGAPYCSYFRSGPIERVAPVTSTVDAHVWDLGVQGLSFHGNARLGFDAGSGEASWPGTEPAVQLVEGYAAYAAGRLTARLGRQTIASRLGITGFDGARVLVRAPQWGLDAHGYAGWGLAQGAVLPITSPALDPLDDFQPGERQIIAGLGAGWMWSRLDLRAEYQREVDPESNAFVSERVTLSTGIGLPADLHLTAGAEYDIAAGWWGSADAALTYATRRVQATLEARRYRPHFELWSIWSAFSPVPYHAAAADVSAAVGTMFRVRGRYEIYEFADAETETPLFAVEGDGWRWELGATVTPRPEWSVDLGYRREFGPGASFSGPAGSVMYRPSRRFSALLLASSGHRPLEFRFNEALLVSYALDAEYAPSDHTRVGIVIQRYDEEHDRPDAAAFEWSQWRASARLTLLFRRDADTRGLPPAIRMLPSGRAAR